MIGKHHPVWLKGAEKGGGKQGCSLYALTCPDSEFDAKGGSSFLFPLFLRSAHPHGGYAFVFLHAKCNMVTDAVLNHVSQQDIPGGPGGNLLEWAG